jgi:hypothetical protein
MLPHAKGLGAGAGDPIKAFSGCSHDGLTCVAGTSLSCVELSDGWWVPSNEANVAWGFDPGPCEVPRGFFVGGPGVEVGDRARLRVGGGPSLVLLGWATGDLVQACDIVGNGSVPGSCCKKTRQERGAVSDVRIFP